MEPTYMQVPQYLRPKEAKPKKGNKYSAVPTERDGIRFASTREANYYDRLKARREAGEVRYFLMQVPFRLPGGTRYVCDYQVHEADGRVRYVDVKGHETDTFKVKKREVEAHFGVEIELA